MIKKFTGKIKLMAPLCHNSDENSGNDTLFRKMKYFCNSEAEHIPIYTGNGIRGKLRRLLADDFLQRVGIGKNEITPKFYHTLFTGGLLEKGSKTTGINVLKIREFRDNIPFLSLFGTALANQITNGKLNVGIGIPICQETKEYTDIESDKSFYELLDSVFYTRKDDLEKDEEEKKTKEKEQAHQMKYNIEVLCAGAELSHSFTLKFCNEIEESCFGAGMALFLQNPILGGNARIGHGEVKFYDYQEFPDPKKYWDYLEENKDKIKEYLILLQSNKNEL